MTADSSPHAVTCQHCDTHYFSRPRTRNFWHPDTLTLSGEHQSAQMSKITNSGLTRSGIECLYPYGNSGRQGLIPLLLQPLAIQSEFSMTRRSEKWVKQNWTFPQLTDVWWRLGVPSSRREYKLSTLLYNDSETVPCVLLIAHLVTS